MQTMSWHIPISIATTVIATVAPEQKSLTIDAAASRGHKAENTRTSLAEHGCAKPATRTAYKGIACCVNELLNLWVGLGAVPACNI